MTRECFLSVITASYNSESTIYNTLVSIRNQKFNSFEHIVIDGGSTDNTTNILKYFATEYDLTWISEPDRGISHALNKALHICNGEYVLVIQADDQILDEYTLSNIYHLIKYENFDIHSFPIFYSKPNQDLILRKPIRVLWWNKFKFIFLHQGALVHKRVFEKIGGFNETFQIAMDYDFFYRALASHCTVKFETMPVALMGADGIGSRLSSLEKRLREEALVQDLNENEPVWRVLQAFFRRIYIPYKIRVLPTLSRLRKHRCTQECIPG